MTAIVLLQITQGETYRRTLLYATPPLDGSAPTAQNVVPIDITGCTARMQVRDKYGAPVLLELSTDASGGLSIPVGADGRILLEMTAAQTDALGAKGATKARESAVYDLELTYPSGDVARVVQGSVAFDPNITRTL